MQEVKQEAIVKKREPLSIWIYMAILIGVVGGYWVFRFFRKGRVYKLTINNYCS
jgi:hypothetical protein